MTIRLHPSDARSCFRGGRNLQGRTRDDLFKDRIRSLAVVRLIEIVGEAASRVSHATRAAHPEIPWGEVIGTRNRLIHAYDQIDFDVLWETIRDELPPLIAALERVLEKE